MFSIKHQSMFVKIFLLFLIVLLLSTVSHILVARKVQKKFLRDQAYSIAKQIVLTRQWIATLGGVWSKNKYNKEQGFLTTYNADSTAESDTIFYLHNPALATREISALANIKFGYTFRVVSDLAREQSNEPDAFETAAIKAIKGRQLPFVDGVENGMYRYAEPLFVKQGCLKCHGDLEKDVKEPMKSILLNKYGNRAFGYKIGDVRGIISIQIPQIKWVTMTTSVFSYWNLLILIASLVIFVLFSKYLIVSPIKNLTNAAEKLSQGKIDHDLGLDTSKSNSKDEIVQLTIAFERLRTSFKILLAKFAKVKR